MIAYDITRLSLLAVVIGYAAYSDYKCGEVANKVWIYAPFGLALTLLGLAFNPQQFLPATLSFGATVALSLILFYIGGWGGADAKATITIGASLPLTSFSLLHITYMYPLMVILISALLAFGAGKVLKIKVIRFLPYVFASLFIALLF